MSQIRLESRLTELANEVARLISELRVSSTLKEWLLFELESLASYALCEPLSLDDCFSKLQGLNQLKYLIVSHHAHIRHQERALAAELACDLLVETRLPAAVRASTRHLRFSIQPSLLHEQNRVCFEFDMVSPTAKVVAYLRGLDRALQFEGDSAFRLEGAALLARLGVVNADTRHAMALQFQSRYHALNRVINSADEPVRQVIEFAAGGSPRGYQWSQQSPDTIYVESDLSQLMFQKAKLVWNTLQSADSTNRGVLHYCAANVLDFDGMLEALRLVDQRMPLAIVTEGLLLYFSPNELLTFLDNVRKLLSKCTQAMWITDFVTRQNLEELLTSHSGVASSVRHLFELTGRGVFSDNPFHSDACVSRYLKEYGLQIAASLPLRDAQPHTMIPELTLMQQRIVGSRKIYAIVARRNS